MNKIFLALLIALFFLNNHSTIAQDYIPSGQTFYIQSNNNYGKNSFGCWDIRGRNIKFKNSQSLIVWQLSDKDKDRKFKFTYAGFEDGFHWYYIIPEYTLGYGVVDVQGGSNKNGTNIQIYKLNHTASQKFRIKHLGNGKWKIYSKLGGILCLNNRSSENGSNIHLWQDHSGAGTEWHMIDVQTNQALIIEKSKTTNLNKTKEEKASPQAAERFKEYKLLPKIKTFKIKFKEGEIEFTVAGTHEVPNSFGFLDIKNQKNKLNSDTYDASGMIIVNEGSQEIFWDKNKVDNQGKIFFFIDNSPESLNNITSSTNLNNLSIAEKSKIQNFLYKNLGSNPSQLNLTINRDSYSEMEIQKYNGYYTAYRSVKANSSTAQTIQSYIVFLENGKCFNFKAIIVDNDRKLILNDLVSKAINSIHFSNNPN
ncbi:MAG: RICIN domain-containing protein [Salinivirgaceae bacterium]|nr:RICIN domain-containing protein [Salinivirgaceae bacterium]